VRGFTCKIAPAHIVFGRGTLVQLPRLMEQIGASRALLLSTQRQADAAGHLRPLLGTSLVGHFTEATMHTPVEVTERALIAAEQCGADLFIGLGGGSTIGLGKALALRTGLPQIAVPTTYAGSEMTPILGETQHGRKTTQRTDKVLPRAVLYDIDLTMGLPASLSGTSGINAIAHAVEGLYAQDTNPVMQLIAQEGIRTLATALPAIFADPRNAEARSEALYGAWLCGMVLGNVGMALHHKLCHTLGGSFNLPHAETHAIILPHVIAYNATAIPDALSRLRDALGTTDPAMALWELGRRVGAPTSLRRLGMPENGIESAAEQAMQLSYWNPRALDRDGLILLLARAWAGEKPQS
jgi:alcohol dehydrogenase class IV